MAELIGRENETIPNVKEKWKNMKHTHGRGRRTSNVHNKRKGRAEVRNLPGLRNIRNFVKRNKEYFQRKRMRRHERYKSRETFGGKKNEAVGELYESLDIMEGEKKIYNIPIQRHTSGGGRYMAGRRQYFEDLLNIENERRGLEEARKTAGSIAQPERERDEEGEEKETGQ